MLLCNSFNCIQIPVCAGRRGIQTVSYFGNPVIQNYKNAHVAVEHMDPADPNKLALVSCMELVLMKSGNENYHLVLAKLNSLYESGLKDCYDHPEYLRIILKEVYQNNYQSVIKEIKMFLDDLLQDVDISRFVGTLDNSRLGSR